MADLGETIDYTFLVTNSGNVTLTDVSVTDDRVTGISAPVTLALGASHEFTSDPYTVVQADLNVGVVQLLALADGSSALGEITSNTDVADVLTPVPDPHLTLEKSGEITTDVDGDGFADVGDTVTYMFTATNIGTVDLTDVAMTHLKVGTTTPATAEIANTDADFTATYVVTQADVDAGAVLNTATASGVYTPPNEDPVTVDSAPANDVVPIPEQAPSLTVEKDGALDDADGNGVADVGETIAYSFEVTNTGNTTLLRSCGRQPRHGHPAGICGYFPVTETFTAATYLVTQADVDAGEVLNSAFARARCPAIPNRRTKTPREKKKKKKKHRHRQRGADGAIFA